MSYLHFVTFAICHICILLHLHYVAFAFCLFLTFCYICILSNLHFVLIPILAIFLKYFLILGSSQPRFLIKLFLIKKNSHPCEEVEELLPFTSCPLGGRAESLSATAFSKEGGDRHILSWLIHRFKSCELIDMSRKGDRHSYRYQKGC